MIMTQIDTQQSTDTLYLPEKTTRHNYMEYPKVLENAWLDRAQKLHTSVEMEDAIDALEPTARKLSDSFTRCRPDQGYTPYLSGNAEEAAYGLLFFPQSYVRMGWVMDWLRTVRQWPSSKSHLRILDVGSGSGACGMAALHAELASQIEIVAVDHSAEALKTGAELAAISAPENLKYSWSSQVCSLDNPSVPLPGNMDLIVLGWSWNELSLSADALLQRFLPLLSPEGVILVLEPAMRAQSEALAELGDLAVERGLSILGPRLGLHSCPLLQDGRFWDHEVRLWNPPQSLSRINRRMQLDCGRHLSFSWLALSQQPSSPDNNACSKRWVRLLSPVSIQKGHLLATACDATGEYMSLQWPTRGLSKRQIKEAVARFERGDILSLAQKDALGQPQRYRAMLDQTTVAFPAPSTT